MKLNLKNKKTILLILFFVGLIWLITCIVHVVGTFYYHTKYIFNKDEIVIVQDEFNVLFNENCTLEKAFYQYHSYSGIVIKIDINNHSNVLEQNLKFVNCSNLTAQLKTVSSFTNNYELYNKKNVKALTVKRSEYTPSYDTNRNETISFYMDKVFLYAEIKTSESGVNFRNMI